MNRQTQQRICSKRQAELRSRATPAERAMMAALDVIGERYVFQKGWLCGGAAVRVVDFYLPAPRRIVLEVDGSAHNVMHDRMRERQILMASKRIRFVRVSNSEAYAMRSRPDKLIAVLAAVRG